MKLLQASRWPEATPVPALYMVGVAYKARCQGGGWEVPLALWSGGAQQPIRFTPEFQPLRVILSVPRSQIWVQLASTPQGQMPSFSSRLKDRQVASNAL